LIENFRTYHYARARLWLRENMRLSLHSFFRLEDVWHFISQSVV